MRLADDGSCALHMCTQAGHTVCTKVAEHYGRLTAAVRALLDDPAPIPPGHRATLEAILAEHPDTSTGP